MFSQVYAMRLSVFAAAAFLLILGGPSTRAQDFETAAPFAILVDADTGSLLLEKNADEPMAPASMAKLMTIELAFHAIEEGRLSLDDTFSVSENAWRRGGAPSGGSTMFLELNSTARLEDLLRGIIIQSGNDASIVLAEGMAGTEIAFADMMNKRAQEIGLKNSRFMNASGLPDPDQHVTARDLAILARHIIQDYPEFYPIFAEPDFTWHNITQRNRNPLLNDGIGVDGLKTGHTEESGYGLVASAKVNTQRLIVVVNGLKSSREREAESRKLLEWGFRSFRQITAFEDGETVGEASLFGGEKGRVALKARGAVRVLVPRASTEPLRARIAYQGPVEAPVEAGVQVGHLQVWQDDRLIQETPLYTAEAVARGPLHRRAFDALTELVFGWI
jgi:D-alanyl-D-alanine carboxypeptidase (penicillin-binding protein 5/6)